MKYLKKEFKKEIKKYLKTNIFKRKYVMVTDDKSGLFIHYTIKDDKGNLYRFIADGRLLDVGEPIKIIITSMTKIGRNSYSLGGDEVYFI